MAGGRQSECNSPSRGSVRVRVRGGTERCDGYHWMWWCCSSRCGSRNVFFLAGRQEIWKRCVLNGSAEKDLVWSVSLGEGSLL
jgi:hypothetical protein